MSRNPAIRHLFLHCLSLQQRANPTPCPSALSPSLYGGGCFPAAGEAGAQAQPHVDPPRAHSPAFRVSSKAQTGEGTQPAPQGEPVKKLGTTQASWLHPIFLKTQSLLKTRAHTPQRCLSEQGLWMMMYVQASKPSFDTLISLSSAAR